MPMTDLSKHDKQMMAAGIRWQLSEVEGIPLAVQFAGSVAHQFGAVFAPGELEARRDELMSDPDFAEAYEAAGSAEGWRAFLARQEGPMS